MKHLKRKIAVYILFFVMLSLYGCRDANKEDTFDQEKNAEDSFEGYCTEMQNVLSVEDILVENHVILQEYVFQYISWKDISEKISGNYEEWISEEGANGRMIYRTAEGITYILPEYQKDIPVNQIAGILLTDEKYKLGCGLQVGMDADNIDEIGIPLEIYNKDENGIGLENKKGEGIALYKGMDNEAIIRFDYAYSNFNGFVLNKEEQGEKIKQLGLPEECCSETHFILIAFVENEKVSGIFMGFIP